MLNLFKKIFGSKSTVPAEIKPKNVIALNNKQYMLDKEIPTEAEQGGYYNAGFFELEDGRKGWMLIPMNKFTVDKFRM